MSVDAPGGGVGHARLLASGSLVQQAAQVTGLVAMFAIVTVLARRLSLSEFGVYGLLTSFAGYLLLVQNAAAGAAVRTMAAAPDPSSRRAAFSTALALYGVAGLLTGAVLALVGVLIAAGLELPDDVERQARLGAALLGVVTALGWPMTIYRDALRASQLFVRAASTEMAALATYVALVLALVYAGASLAVVIAASGSIPLLVGVGSLAVARASDVPVSFGRDAVTRQARGELLGTAGYLSLTEAAAAAIYAIDRVILGLFRSARTVGLYEGPIRAHNLIRALNAAVTVTVLPSAARYYSSSDSRRLGELLLRGSRYTLALIVPLTVTGMVLAGPILGAWLGDDFRRAGPAMAILLSHWLLNGCSGVAMSLLVGVGRAREVARYAMGVATGNVVLALALTPPFGLEGVALATAVPYAALFPVLIVPALSATPLGGAVLARESFLPTWSLGAVLAAALVGLRLVADPTTAPSVMCAALVGPLAYWLVFYAVWLRPDEQRLVLDVARGLVPSRLRARRGG